MYYYYYYICTYIIFKLNSECVFVCRTIKWYVTAHMKFVRESLQGIEKSSSSFRTHPDIISDVDSYEPQDLLDALFNLVAGYVSIGSGWQFESVQSLAINLYPYRPTIGAGSFIETPKSLYNKGVVNIQNEHDDYCLLWSFSLTSTELRETQTDSITTANILMN